MKRAFSLVELMVASVVAVILMTITVGVWANVNNVAARARQQAALEREVAFANRVLNQDLRQTGLGVPVGAHIQRSCAGGCQNVYGAAPPTSFYAAVIVAAADQVGIVGDVVRPNAQYNTMGPLSTFRTGSLTSVAWHTENNGNCIPPLCSTGDTSFFFPQEAGCLTDALDRTCPWGMSRVQAGDRIQIVAGNGNWSHAAASTPLAIEQPRQHVGLALTQAFDRSGPDNVWSNAVVDGAGPGGIPGAGWVTTLDRVFFRQNGDVLERIQCWGDVDPNHPNWPDASAATIPATLTFTPDSAGLPSAENDCTEPEVVARFVESFRLRYYTANGLELGTPVTGALAKKAIGRIDYELVLRRRPSMSRDIVKATLGSVRVNNL